MKKKLSTIKIWYFLRYISIMQIRILCHHRFPHYNIITLHTNYIIGLPIVKGKSSRLNGIFNIVLTWIFGVTLLLFSWLNIHDLLMQHQICFRFESHTTFNCNIHWNENTSEMNLTEKQEIFEILKNVKNI